MRLVALGGNALLHRGEAPEAEALRRNIEAAIERAIAPLARRHELVITHGSGPQIGLLALQASAYKAVGPLPVCSTPGGISADPESRFGLLSDDRRAVLLLSGFEGMPYEKAAIVLAVPVGTVRSRLARARLSLRRLMEGDEGRRGQRLLQGRALSDRQVSWPFVYDQLCAGARSWAWQKVPIPGCTVGRWVAVGG